MPQNINARPKKFDYNLIVIGGGAGGLVSSYIASAVNAKVALIEQHHMGGDCLNTGCVPSKALIKSAKIAFDVQRAAAFGFKPTTLEHDFSAIMKRVQRVIKKVEPHDSVERYRSLGVDCYAASAVLTTPYQVTLSTGEVLTARTIIIATGAKPFIPTLPGIENINYLTSDNLWELREQPKKLLILGGGPIGCELAQAFQRLGSQVTLVQRDATLIPREDLDISQRLETTLSKEGVNVLTRHTAKAFSSEHSQTSLICEHNNTDVSITFDSILIAIGRKANTQGLGLEALNIQFNDNGTIKADAFMRTNIANIYVCGDITGPYQFTHVAAHQAWYASVNALFSPFKKFRADYAVIPWATYTDPEIARVGLNEREAIEQNIRYELTTFDISDLDRAITDEEDHGIIKVLTPPGKDRILGVTIMGHHASDFLAEFVLAMTHGLGLNKILGTIHTYPTMAEANKYLAGNWKKNHAPQSILKLLRRFHHWRRA